MGGKSGGGSRSPRIDKNTLNSAQKLKIIDLISSGEISGFIHGNDYPLKSVYLNDTPVQNSDGSMNHAGVQFEFNKGTLEQDYLPSAASVDNSVSVGVEVEKKNPITRTITNQQITSVRVTVGVDSLMRSTREGDQLATSVDMSIQIVKNGQVHASQHMHLNEKGNQPFRVDYVFSDLPAAPFDIKCIRLTADSNDDMLRNKTYFFSYVESIDSKLRMPGSAVAMLQIDSQQFGSSNPTRNYGVLGCIVQVPSNYDPVTRTYSGLWDRLFKPAYTNNPAWVLYDVLTNDECFGDKFKDYHIDIDRLYELSKYCDVLVDDGLGGKEPRFVCNMVLFGSDAATVLDNICSIFRGTYSNANNHFTVQFDQKSDPVAVYNNSSVENGEFNYSYVPSTELFNQVKVEYIDKEDGYRTKIDEVSDEANIAKYGLKSTSITAFGCTKRSYALRCAKWNLVTSLTENETVTFAVGAAGIRHEQHDIIKIADNDYAGAQIGGRIESVNGNTITVDRELKNVKEFMINVNGSTKTFKVVREIDAKTYQLDAIVNAVDYVQYVAVLNNLEPRLFRCIHIEEDSDVNKYTITAIKHNPQKEAIVDRGAEYIEGNYSLLNPLPQLSNGTTGTEGKFIVLRWDSIETAGSKNKYIVHLYRGTTLILRKETGETFLRLENLPQGNYTARIRAINEQGQHSSELAISFSTTYEISGFRYTPIIFGIRLNWEVPQILTTEAFTEVWYSESNDRSTATKLAAMPYPQNSYTLNGLSIGDEFYFWLRLVDINGNQGEFTHALLAKPSQSADDILGYLKGQITATELGDDVVNGIIKDVLNDAAFDQKVTDIIDQSDIIYEINNRIGSAESELQMLSLSKATADSALTAQSLLINAKTDLNEAQIQVVNMAESSNMHAHSAQLSLIKADFDGNIASIKSEQSAQADQLSAQAQSISKISANVGENSASISESKKAIATIDGKVEATYSLTANANGVITGFKFGSDGKQGVFNIMANSFVISNQVDGKVVTPFVLWGNKLALDGDLIAIGSISGDKIIANTTIRSPNIEGGALNIGNGRFKVDSLGNVSISENPARNVGLKISSNRIDVYDSSGKLRVRMGEL
ncbi:DUF1983 domain-containing protein [Wohlfahrtiimonas chitiniclastica]|uniref:host specificity protein J n=1 Tax=Wohlfahrtiimonas chitiniclastica TaxID=400946 RepID=UPI001BCA77C0|nr:phage tail protein [Wohlfahrtiimonas chitiniclastica]MBS7827379.1 DUF1983 domain-containing protein [Wohlfahrtiimonas chitiniclastica]